MASSQELIAGSLLSRQKVFQISAHTSYPVMQIQYIGSAAAATVAVAAGGDMTLTETGQSDVVIDLSTPAAARDTYGELAAEINALANWRCYLIGVLPSASTDNTLATLSAADAKTTSGITLFADPAVLITTVGDVGWAITNNKFTGRPSTGWAGKYVNWERDTDASGVGLVENVFLLSQHTITQTSAGAVEFYSVDDVLLTSSLLYSNAAYTSATAQTIDFRATPLKAIPGHRLVVLFNSASAAQTAAVVNAVGYTRHLLGIPVPGANYTGLT